MPPEPPHPPPLRVPLDAKREVQWSDELLPFYEWLPPTEKWSLEQACMVLCEEPAGASAVKARRRQLEQISQEPAQTLESRAHAGEREREEAQTLESHAHAGEGEREGAQTLESHACLGEIEREEAPLRRHPLQLQCGLPVSSIPPLCYSRLANSSPASQGTTPSSSAATVPRDSPQLSPSSMDFPSPQLFSTQASSRCGIVTGVSVNAQDAELCAVIGELTQRMKHDQCDLSFRNRRVPMPTTSVICCGSVDSDPVY